ncbi:FtsK/SpoIIIE domain-containing protein [Mesorhizobium sp. M0991]|uniref:FtsK/SpoIIIE domain-containing protein n=1 Tax=Mesorhizobium sp. M0991 TaxID=2957043 RepID=UPI003334FE5A
MSTLELIGQVAARRLSEVRDSSNGRAFYCIIGMDAAITSAIAKSVAKDAAAHGGGVEVFVHPQLAVGDVSPAIVSDQTAPWHRNHATPGMKLTVCTVPPDMVKATEPTLAHNSKIDEAWLLQSSAIWSAEALKHSSDEIRNKFTNVLEGVLGAFVAHDAETIGNFVSSVVFYLIDKGLAPENAVRAALPALRLPRDSGDPRMKITESPETAARFFRKIVEDAQPAIYLRAKDGDPLNRGELRQRLADMKRDGTLNDDVHDKLQALVADRGVHDGQWTPSQQAVSEVGWDRIEPFFSDAKRKPKQSFGGETKSFFDRQYPGTLKAAEDELLADLAKENLKPSELVDDFFARHRPRLQTDPKLYKRWERMVFRAPIETRDLGEGMLRLAHRAFPETDDADGDDVARVLFIRLRNAEKMDFWASEKNTRILRYLRDRYRGLLQLLAPHTVLDFGRCWEDGWEQNVAEENTSSGKAATELEFEAFFVTPEELEVVLKDRSSKPHANRAQMIWKPHAEALGLSLSIDLRQIRQQDAAQPTHLISGRIHQNRASRSAAPSTVDLAQRSSVSDAFQQSEGLLANPGREENRIDVTWPRSLAAIVEQGVITSDQGQELRSAYDAFVASYGAALDALVRGTGIGAEEILLQAELYGDLLRSVMTIAPQELCIRDLLSPLVSIGLITVEGETPSAILTAWHPLRLAEIGAKARQLADAMTAVVMSDPKQRSGIEDFVGDRIATLGRTYYGDIALLPGLDAQLVAETQAIMGYSLLEPISGGTQHGVTNEPADAAIAAFDRVADEYLKLRPHERANFSVVILNADSENLPLAMANGLSRRVEDDSEIRCELVVTDDDPIRLRQVYERQNRRISHEIDTSLASEAARNFLSRLRVGIFSPETLAQETQKANDVVVLQDVIARSSKVRWTKGFDDGTSEEIATFVPTARSKRRPFRKGNTTSALYLTAPRQPLAGRIYVDALRTIMMRDVATNPEPWLPVQEVEFKAGEVSQILAKAHKLGNWVMTFDRVADRRLIATDERRIIRYFSVPGSTHNVIVSTEITERELGDCIDTDVGVLLQGLDADTLSALRHELFTRAAQLSGGVVMRGAQWANYAHELLGLVLSQRELDRLLRVDRENRTAWFFLDDYRDWLDLTGEMADILAIDLAVGANGPEIRVVIAEAKYVGQDGISEHRKRSASQLEATWTALNHRLLGGSANLDPAIWRHRLADMVLEHMEPFDQVGGIGQDRWLEGLREGTFPISVDGYSMVFSHELDTVFEPMPHLPDEAKVIAERRRLAQWVFSRAETAEALRGLADDTLPAMIHVPAGWPQPNAGAEAGESKVASTPQGNSSRGRNRPSDDAPPPPTPEPEPNKPSPTSGAASAGPDDVKVADEPPAAAGPWSPQIMKVLHRLRNTGDEAEGRTWLTGQIDALRAALQAEGMDAPVMGQRLTPNTGLVYVGGRTLTVAWLERKRTDLLTRYGLDIVRISPMPGQIAIGLRRPARAILHLADAWLKRAADPVDGQRTSPLLGEKEDDGTLCYLPLASSYIAQERAAPHSLISGTTGSGKGILVTNLMLDLCALNSPGELEMHLIDPKRGVDYAWARRLPHLKGGIIDDQEEAMGLLERLVGDMDRRYDEISRENCRNIDQYNRKMPPGRRMPRIVIFFDEVANWMQDDDFKKVVDGLINKIATKSRAAGFHLFMVYQRADNHVMTMQLRTNLGNKMILRLGDEGSSRIALGEAGAERLLGKGHLIAKLDTDDKIYLQVPFIGDDEVEELADAVIATWLEARQEAGR